MTDRTRSSSARFARDSAGLVAGTLVNGLCAYVFFALTTRELGATAAAPVAVLWTYWGVSTAVVTFPVQHWIIRTMRATGEGAVRDALPRISRNVLAFAAVATALSWLVDDQLFHHRGPVFPVLVGLVTLGSFFTGVVRGGLAGRERFAATALALAADNVLRVVLAIAVLQTGGGAVGLGVVLVAAALVGLLWPAAYRFQRDDGAAPAHASGSLLGAIATGSALGQFVLLGGPAVLAFLGGAPSDVTMVFVTLALFRAPYLLALGVANQVTGMLTGWATSSPRHMQRFQAAVAAVTVVGAVAATGVGYAIGPPVVGAVFGGESAPPAWVAAVVAAGSVVAVGNLALSLIAIAQGRGARLTWAWVVATIVVLVTVVALPVAHVAAVTWSFLAGEATAFGVLLWSGWSRGPATGTELPPDEVAAAPLSATPI